MKIQPLLSASIKRDYVLKDPQPKLHAEIINFFRLSTSNITGTNLDIALIIIFIMLLFLYVYTIVDFKTKTLK